nr:hypothetical protein [Tanacetum cinerariifolium]
STKKLLYRLKRPVLGLNKDKMCCDMDNVGFVEDDDVVEDEVVGVGAGRVSRVDRLEGIQSLITVEFHKALDSPSSTSGHLENILHNVYHGCTRPVVLKLDGDPNSSVKPRSLILNGTTSDNFVAGIKRS